ncbi:hypothetical protein MKEN_01343300 [Mycena kentingensis (nom. inval.)]|nr:hypothetical protein MKEN_01343300 [Mycena kentingensis (nom. inval.)]
MLQIWPSLLLLVSAVVAQNIAVEAPVAPVSGGETTIHWTPNSEVQTFSVELIHTEFNNAFAIANNVDASTGVLKCTLPSVPATGGYTIKFVNIGDINDVYGESSSFPIAAPPSTSETPSASMTPTASASASAYASGTATMPMSVLPASATSSAAASASAASAAASASASASAKHNKAATLHVRETFAVGATTAVLVLACWIL